MKVLGRISLLILNLLACNIVVATNYYALLGISRDAARDTIRQKCIGIPALKKEQARLAKEYEKVRQNLRVVVGQEGRAKLQELLKELEKELKQVKWKMDRSSPRLWNTSPAEIEKACEILRDPQEKAFHDQDLSLEEAREGGPLGVEIVGTYYQELKLPQNASPGNIKERCDSHKKEFTESLNQKKIERNAAQSVFEKNRLDQEVRVLETKLANTNFVCQILLDPQKKKKYDAQLKEEPEEEIKEYKGVFGGIRKAVKSVAKDSDKLVVDLIGEALTQIPIPDAAASVFNQKLAMRNMSFLKAPMGPKVRTGLGFTGTMFFNNFAVKGTVYVIEDQKRKMQYSLAMELPEHYKISDMFSKFKKLDALSLPRGKFVLSTYDYYDTEGYSIKRGFNFAASLDLTGPLQIINTLKDKAKNLKSVIVRAEPIRFQGLIPVNITKAEFSAKLPIYLGIDFTKIAHMPKSVVKIFKEVTTDDLEFVVTAPPKLSFTIESGVRLVLGTQKAPIRLSAFGIIDPTSFSLGMRMRNMLELKWLELGNAGIQFDWDEALMPAAAMLGIPFTGIGVNGQIEVGKPGESRATFIVSAGARVSSKSLPDLVFETEAKNIRFTDLIRLFLKVASKTKLIREPVPFDKLPAMTLERVRGFLSLEDTKIAGKDYDAGFALEADALFFNRRAGFSFDLRHTAMQCSGSGYVSNIDLKLKGKTIFKLTGPPFTTKAGKSVEGPAIDFYFGLKKPDTGVGQKEKEVKRQFLGALEGRFGVRGILDVPAVALKQSVDFEWSGWNLRTNLETTYAGFTVLFGVQINLKAGKEMVSPYDLARREVEHLLASKDPADSNTVAAQEIMKKVGELEAKNRYVEAKTQLDRAMSLLEKARYKSVKKKKDVEVPDMVRVEGMEIAQFEQMEVLFGEIATLAERARLFGQENDFKYEQALKIKAAVVKEYLKLVHPEKLKELKEQLRFRARDAVRQEGEKILVDIGTRVNQEIVKIIGNKIIKPLERAKLLLQDLQPQHILKSSKEAATIGKYAALVKKEEKELDPGKKWRQMYIKFGFKGDFAKFLSEQARPALDNLKDAASGKLAKLNEAIGDLSKKVSELGAKGEISVEEEIRQTREKIKRIEDKIKEFKQERAKIPKWRVAKRGKVTAKIAAQNTAIGVQKLYLGGLVQPSKKVIKGVSKVVASATESLHKAQLLKKSVEKTLGGLSKAIGAVAKGVTIFRLSEAIGEVSSEDIMAAKLPRIISLQMEVNIPGLPQVAVSLHNIQFDFKNPFSSAEQIVMAVLQGGIRIVK